MSAAVRGRPVTDFYGEGPAARPLRMALSAGTLEKLAATYQENRKPRRLRVVPPPAFRFEDLSPAMRRIVRRECRRRGIGIAEVEIRSPREVWIP